MIYSVVDRVSAGHIGELLLREGLISNDELDEALEEQRRTDQPLIRVMVDSGILEETQRLNFFRRQFGTPIVSLGSIRIDPILYTYIPSGIARKHHLVPVRLDRDGLLVAMEDPSDVLLIDHLKGVVGLRIKPVVAPSDEINLALEGYPQEQVEPQGPKRVERFDPIVRFMRKAFLPIMSAGVLVTIILLVLFYQPAQAIYNNYARSGNPASQIFNLFIYFFLTWGVWTIIMFEINGLVFEDLEWHDPMDIGAPKSNSKALMLSLFLGWLGLDRFYLGYKMMGIIKLATLGLAGIWWLLDIFAIGKGSVPDAAGRPTV